ncbi:MAG: class I adenylate-forming enzyme family protein [Acidimicrobiales bacterium]
MLDRVVREAAAQYGDDTAYRTADGWSVSYRDLDRLSDEVAAGLAHRGVEPGQVVALVLPSVVEYIVAYLGAAKRGAITAGCNPRLGPHERARVIDIATPSLVITTPNLAEGLPDHVDTVVIEPASSADGVLAMLRVEGGAPDPLPEDPERPVLICFTSGSTGDPKGALFANRQLQAISDLDTGGAWGTGGHRIAPTEFAHVGIMTKLPWMLASGGTTHLLAKWRAEPILELIDRHRIPAVSGVAPQIALMLQVRDLDRFDFECVKAIVAGGSASPPALVDEARHLFGAPYSIRYSSTESGGVGLGTALDADDEEALHTIGRPRLGVEADIRDDAGQPVAAGDVGELWIRSPAVMSEYWNNPEATAETLVDGWLRTGDLARIDERGLFRLAGRIKEMFIRGGYNVYPAEVEAVLGTHPAVAEVVVVPRPDPVMGEIGVAVVVPRADHEPPTLDQLREHGADQLAAYKLPEAIRTMTSLPRNGTDKVDRRTLTAAER